MKKEFGGTYLGLDMGTASVGYAVTDKAYKILKFNGKGMWGVRLFEEAKTAADMRLKRCNRRRLERRSWRVKLLQSLFSDAIAPLDMGFFLRQAESNLQSEDKSVNNRFKNSLFGDGFLSDKEYHMKYPSIYHLRLAQLNDEPDAFDPRLLYLSISHMVKYRGHFLFDNLKVDLDTKTDQTEQRFENAYKELINCLKDNLPDMEEHDFGRASAIKAIMTDKDSNITTKKRDLEKEISAGKDKVLKSVAGLLSGGTVKLSELFSDENLQDIKLQFKGTDFDAVEDELISALDERMEVIYKFKAVYDLGILEELLHGTSSISQAKVDTYREHQEDLKLLKKFVLEQDKALFKKIFGIPEGKETNYSVYIGRCLTHNSKKAVLSEKVCSKEDFCKYLKKVLKDYVDVSTIKDINTPTDRLFNRINNEKAFPKLRDKSNAVIPMQLHLAELRKILKNAERKLSFLSTKDESGLSVSDKIISIFKFRVPYYVGPLAGTEMSKKAKRCWVKRSNEKITPWNFDKVVDLPGSAEAFIEKMTNKCTYLYTEDVLPKQSLLYSEFEARNELNNITIDGDKIEPQLVKEIMNDLIIAGKGKVTKKKIVSHLFKKNVISSNKVEISGIDDDIKSTLKSHKDFYRIFGREYVNANYEQIENIIRWITLFSDEKRMLVTKIKEHYPDIPEEKVKEIKKLNYKEWGRLSKTFLNSEEISFYDDSIGEYITIIGAMRRNAVNLMQLLAKGNEYGFADRIEEFNFSVEKPDKIDYSYIEEMAVSPAVKRAIWQTVQIVQELKKIIGHDPERIFIEMAREEGEKQRTRSRKDQLLELYKKCKTDAIAFGMDYEQKYSELSNQDEAALRGKKLFLYYCQMGRDLYTGKKISISELFSQNVYDVDHIYPRSKTKDDSLDNLVLVHHNVNLNKGDKALCETPYQTEANKKLWTFLLEKGLISKKKYDRLVRNTPLTEDELAGFINRQLVETRQSTKAVANLLSIECPNSKIVYSKAGNVSDFRKVYDFVKCRDINDLHHAKDAYLNIVVGNVFYTKFTDRPYEIIKDRNFTYTLNPDKIYEWEIKRKGTTAWMPGDDGSISIVRRMMNKNNIQVTNMLKENHGEIFDANICKASDAKLFPIKKGLSPQKYGGYNSQSTAYFVYVESDNKKGQKERTLEAVYCHVANSINDNQEALLQFIKEEYGFKNPRIIIPKVKIGACLEIGDIFMIVTGTTGTQLTGKNAKQLVVDKKYEKYFKRVRQYLEKKKDNAAISLERFKEISFEANVDAFDMLVEKIKSKAYRERPAIKYDEMVATKAKFILLTVDEQCIVINEFLKLLAESSPANLLLLGLAKNKGDFKISKKMPSNQKVFLHNYSITGLFEQQPIDLLKI
ncbi:MAG: type II CRISPR RNA-guided endonuclease Cas9 [Anaerovibrio sp.]|uniref:type II CRISPR RNA-guided endonuclease Cas9 n=1 Tax=Anaerovibrio sp. TaxID=1872532 RepID=UPI0025C24A8A|nr:type II CRISPR RNA-guided endonuclease Cas9 [Anaerovibrio sp.]MBE6098590.1 type II CRISPR RNA-guided endonuclease Cas9 [Anaerovibrio sp.]